MCGEKEKDRKRFTLKVTHSFRSNERMDGWLVGSLAIRSHGSDGSFPVFTLHFSLLLSLSHTVSHLLLNTITSQYVHMYRI